MSNKKNIFVIIGSASKDSANEKLIDYLSKLTSNFFTFTVFKSLKTIPHFDPELSTSHPPKEIIELRKKIGNADGVIICTPEYIFSIPSGLKNLIEWCVATTIFTDKATGLITASAHGQKGHEELQLIMKTVMAKYTKETSLLIQGIKGKIDDKGIITDNHTIEVLMKFTDAFQRLLENPVL